jgi:hypothetical protein
MCGVRTVFWRFRISRKWRPFASSSLSVRISVRRYQRAPHWKDFCEILYGGLLQKICQGTPDLVEMAQKHRALWMKN